MIRRLMLFTALLTTVIAPLSQSGALAHQAPNVATPANAAVYYSQLEAIGSFEVLYQWIHPDAKSIVPASAVVGWYTNEFAPSGPGVITVTGVTMTTWTWEVTGQTYPNTAEVSFQQPFANGTVIDDVVRLVESDGEWRWFFGRNRDFVDAQIARYGDLPVTSSERCAGAAEWWAETYPRILSVEYFMYAFSSNWNGGNANVAWLDEYSDLFNSFYHAQSLSTPPLAANQLQSDVLEMLNTLHRAAAALAAVAGGNINPLAASGALGSGFQGIDRVGGMMLSFGSTVDAFLLECEPVVVFVISQGAVWPTGILPGQVGSGIREVSCSNFVSQQEAQRFFDAALPGDPHGLDQDADGIACNSRPQRDAGSSSTASLYTTPGMTLTPRSHRTTIEVHTSASAPGLLAIVLPKGLEASASSGCVDLLSMAVPHPPLCETRTIVSQSGETTVLVNVPAGSHIYLLAFMNLSMEPRWGEIEYRFTAADHPTQYGSTTVDSGSD